MASVPPLTNQDREQNSSVLLERLAAVLPQGAKFGVYHLSTPPTKTTALFNPPPDVRPDRTYCENQFLAITVNATSGSDATTDEAAGAASKPRQVIVLALEIFIFTTAFSSIFFISKADSTGYLHLLGLAKGAPSPIREISSAFVAYLVEQRQRKGLQSVVTLFARAQAQYLFPGSSKNGAKHVLDDRGLVKWWCRVLNPLMEGPDSHRLKSQYGSIRGFLVVPGLDHRETQAFVPRTPSSSINWCRGHPLEEMSHYCQEYDWVPPRCLIPKYPDDPKSRFRDELDEEASKWKQDMGAWKSIKSVSDFWELMAFRQECSSGRLTGFIWIVFSPKPVAGPQVTRFTSPPPLTPSASFDGSQSTMQPNTPPRRIAARGPVTPQSSPLKRTDTSSLTVSPSKPKPQKAKKKVLRGAIIPRQPRIKTHQRNYLVDRPVSTAYYCWPAEGRGRRIVDESLYKRCVELLLHLDFATLEKAVSSTSRWISEVGMGSNWGVEVVGLREIPIQPTNGSSGTVNNLTGLVKRKRTLDTDPPCPITPSAEEPANKVNVLGAGLIRKKRGNGEAGQPAGSSLPREGQSAVGDEAEEPKVNVLAAGLVRKKPKPQ